MHTHTRPFAAGDLDAVHRLLLANGWAHRIASAEALARLIQGAQRAVVALDEEDGEIIGFARAITDGLSNGYLSMVVVAPPWRGRGVGSALVEAIVGDEPGITWVLRAEREGAAEFFSKLGFRTSTTAMERPRSDRPGSRGKMP